MGNLANKWRYNSWCSKMDDCEYFGITLTYAEREKLFRQARSGKLTPAQCDSIMDRNHVLVKDKIGRLVVNEVVESLIGDEYTVASWNWDGPHKNELLIRVKESERFIVIAVDHEGKKAEGYVWYHDEMLRGSYKFLYDKIMEIPEV